MRRLLLVFVAVALLLAGAFVVLAPATLVTSRVEKLSGGTVAARNVDGTIWRGRGVLAGSGAELPLAWELDPQSLLRGELRAHIGPYAGTGAVPRADVLAGQERLELRDVDLTLPVPLLGEIVGGRLAHRFGLVAGGDISVRSDRLDWVPPTINGDLDVLWRNARLSLPAFAPVDLGDLTARLRADGQRLSGPVDNSGGVMDIRGDLTVFPDKRAVASLLLTPRRADDTLLAAALSAIGTAEGGGWRVNWQTPPR
jgi:hypothetical protein